MMGNQMMYGPYGGGPWIFIHFFFWILLVVGLVLLIVWIVRQVGRHESGRGEESAFDILKKRYARGEISKEDFDKMKKDIS